MKIPPTQNIRLLQSSSQLKEHGGEKGIRVLSMY